MKKVPFLLVCFMLVVVACAPTTPANNRNTSMNNQTGSGGMMNATATPGAMMATNPATAHMMEPITAPTVEPASANQGGQLLNFRLVDDVKVFELTAKAVKWTLTDGVEATAYTYNGTVPGPMIRVTEGDKVRIIVTNQLPEPTTIHWHGVEVPNAMDGVPGLTQDPIQPGETFTYEFVAKPAGTYMYHSHYDGDIQVGAGLYAPFIIDPKEPEANPPTVDKTLMLSEWLVRDGITYAAMPMGGMEPNYFTINAKAFPSTETINVKKGDVVRLRLIGIGQFIHPMHLHGMAFKIVATDGHPVPEATQLTKDTISVAPGERYDIEFVATEPGQWMLHCHILHHTTNDNVEPGGLMLIINVTE
jgi:FtsP/CotA-like multicopper oxidase with cupredoxin domain